MPHVWDGVPANEWAGFRQAAFGISRTHSHHMADMVTREHPWVLPQVEDALLNVGGAVCLPRRRRRNPRGIDPSHFNSEIRRHLVTDGWSLEARVEHGVIFDNERRVIGFDIAHYDIRHNLANLWSACFGQRRLHNGDQVWRAALKARPEWDRVSTEVTASAKEGRNLSVPKQEPTVFGEIQCGNWGLVYRDFLKLLVARDQAPVDLFLYLVPDGDFTALLSDGTVNYEKSVEALQGFGSVINVPTLVVGIEILSIDEQKTDIPEDIQRRIDRRVTRRTTTGEPGSGSGG